MNTEMTIGKRFMITSGICLILMLVLAGVSISGLHTVGGGITVLSTNAIPSAYVVGDISTDVSHLRGDYWRHMATNSPEAMDRVEAEIASDKAQLDKDYRQYSATIDDNAEDKGTTPL